MSNTPEHPPKRPRPQSGDAAKTTPREGAGSTVKTAPRKPLVREAAPAVSEGIVKAAADKSAPRDSGRDPGARPRKAVPIRREPRRTETPSPAPARQINSLEDLGALLKTKREIQGLTRKDVVVKIKIPLEQLESIEDGRLSSLPPVFAKGFLRVYANELGLDAEAILEDYRRMTGGFKNEPASREPLAPRYVESSVGNGRRWRPGPRFLVATALVAAAVGATIWLWPSLKGFIPFMGDSVRMETEVQPASGPLVPVVVVENDPDTMTAATGSLESPIESDETAPATAPEPELNGGTLTLSSLRDNVWVQVVVDGRPPQHLILKTGQQATWEADKYVTVTSGLANSLNVIWNGQDLGSLQDLTPQRKSPIAEIRFPRG